MTNVLTIVIIVNHKIISKISRSQIKEGCILFVSTNEVGPHGKTVVILENGQKMLLPPTITKVPALLLVSRGYHVLFGNDIYRHLEPKEKIFNETATGMNGEPLAFSITEMAGASDCYSYLDMTSDELSAKGSGGTRMMHSYVSLDHEDPITTPPEDMFQIKLVKIQWKTATTKSRRST